MRCEPNISLQPVGSDELGTKVEVKNLNSFRAVKQALAYEIERQAAILDAGGQVRQVTMRWDENRGCTVEQRTKETSEDYRYFPEPDLPPLRIPVGWVDRIRATLPELPAARQARFAAEYELAEADAALLAEDREVADYFEAAVAAGQARNVPPATTANWITGELFRLLKAGDVEIGQVRVLPEALAELLALVEGNRITANSAKTILAELFETGGAPAEIVARRGLAQISDEEALARVVEEVIAANPEEAASYRAGKETLIQWFVGQVMRATRGKANPQVVVDLLQKRLKG
jgi:aspartyl-tRNA(Asn)/glutamyl-tRNA(Gln) amidotransferase subunit B